ncbi:MAG: hypothetical protein HFJ49_02350 [Clostridia bacterium]|nr:hypothetical protein [Clostridia bacterium]
MNQILYTGKNKSKADVNKVLKIFTVLLVIFAICFIALGVYLYKGVKPQDDIGNNQPEPTPEPQIESKIDIAFSSISDGVRVKIKSNLEISKATYRWDDEPENNIEIGENLNEIVKEVEIRQGIHTLYITVVDSEGNQQTKEQSVIGDKEPELVITTDGVDTFIIQAKDDERLSRIKIVLNGEVVLEQELTTTEFEYKVKIPQGDSLIEATVYNLNELVNTKRGRITGFSR